MQSHSVNGLSANPNQIEKQHQENIFKRVLMALNKLDLDDFIVAIFRSVFSEKIVNILGPFIIGGLSLFGLINEGLDGIKEAWSAYRNEECAQRKTKIATGALAFAAGVTGMGLVLAYIAGGLGAAVLGFGYMPFIIPAVLTSIYGFALWRKSYVLSRAKEIELKQYNAYQKELQEKTVELEIYKQKIDNLTNQRSILQDKLMKLKNKLNHGHTLGAAESINFAIYTDSLKQVDERLAQTTSYLEQLKKNLESSRLIYGAAHQKTLEAEKEVAFSTIEVFCSTAALVGTFLGLTAIFSATTIASFGLVPAFLIFGGGILGLGIKIFEMVDDRYDNRFTNSIRNFFTKTWRSFFGPRYENDYHLPLELQPSESSNDVKPGGTTTPLLKVMTPNSKVVDKTELDPKDTLTPQVNTSLSSDKRLGNPKFFDSVVVPEIGMNPLPEDSLKITTPVIRVES